MHDGVMERGAGDGVTPLSALSHDVQRIGEMVGETVLAVLDGQRPPTLEAPPIVFVPRATTGPPAP